MRESQRLRDAFNYLFQEELDFLYEITESLPANPTICNIGAGAGTSGLAFLEARPDSHVYTIDITNEDSPYGTLLTERMSAHAAGVSDRLTQFHGDSVAVGNYWDVDTPLDLIFIDGDHSYEGCYGDIETWLAHVKKMGYILVHDYNKLQVFTDLGDYDKTKYPHWKELPGVDRAVDEFKDDERLEFIKTVATIAVFRKV